MTRYKACSWWHRQRDARWAELVKAGVTPSEIAVMDHYSPSTVSRAVVLHRKRLEATNALHE